MEASEWNPTVSRFANGVYDKLEGFGTILLAVMIDEKRFMLLVKDVLYVPDTGCNLYAPRLSLDQGWQDSWRNDARLFCMMNNGVEVLQKS